MSAFKLIAKNLFFSKNDPNDIRLGDLFKNSSLNEFKKIDTTTSNTETFCVVGYPDDEGIQLNGGRTGAATAPDFIRQYLYKMTPPNLSNQHKKQFFDIGNLLVETTDTKFDLAKRHQLAQDAVSMLQSRKIRSISLGGGHDYAYSDTSAFLKTYLSSSELNATKPVVLNFDAHLDVRPSESGYNSGTPFYRLLCEFENQFEFAEIGIQPQCNSGQHRDWALNKNAHIFNLKDIELNGGLLSLFTHPLFSNMTKSTPVFISFDIDCLTSTEAPGCSQSWVTGLKTENYLNFFTQLSARSNIQGLGIYEVSPPLDLNNQTSKTAALIAYHYLFAGNL